MRQIGGVILLAVSITADADSHAGQALHPYWGHDESYVRYMEHLKEPVNGYVTTYDGRDDPDYGAITHLFFYAVNIPGATTFTLDISCPSNEHKRIYGAADQAEGTRLAGIGGLGADPIRKNPPPSITKKSEITWSLDPSGGKQGMWFYSDAKIATRGYTVTVVGSDGKADTRKGTVEGPSCTME